MACRTQAGAIIALERRSAAARRACGGTDGPGLQALLRSRASRTWKIYICQFIAEMLRTRFVPEWRVRRRGKVRTCRSRGAQKFLTDAVGDRRDLHDQDHWLAMAVARQGRLAEAAQIIAPAVDYQRSSRATTTAISGCRSNLPRGSMPRRLASRPGARRCLHEAQSLLDSAPAEIRPLHDIRLMRQRSGPPCTASHRVPLEPRGAAPVSLQRHSRISETSSARSRHIIGANSSAKCSAVVCRPTLHGADSGGAVQAAAGRCDF